MTATKTLFERLAENLEPTGEDGWVEDPDDRVVKITDTELVVKTTFEHWGDDRGGRHRVSTTFTVEGDTLRDDNDNSCPLTDEAALQAFVNESCGFWPG